MKFNFIQRKSYMYKCLALVINKSQFITYLQFVNKIMKPISFQMHNFEMYTKYILEGILL